MTRTITRLAATALAIADGTYDYNASPYNYDNSPYNSRSGNGVFDNTGKRIGYEVQAPSGVINIFDNQGNRIGHQPAKRR